MTEIGKEHKEPLLVKDLLSMAVEIDSTWFAHRVYWAIKSGKVSSTDDADQLSTITYDDQQIDKLLQENVLQIGHIKLYVAETKAPGVYAFYYGRNIVEVQALHQKLFQERPKKWKQAKHLLIKSFHFYETKQDEILYFHRTKAASHPYYLGHINAGEEVLWDARLQGKVFPDVMDRYFDQYFGYGYVGGVAE